MKLKKIDHMVITTADIEKCLDFYGKLGFEVQQGGGRYELFAGDFKINVHQKGRELEPKAKFVQPGSGDFCFEIHDTLSDVVEELQRNQINIEMGIVSRQGVKGMMKSIYIRDTDGNLLEFCTYL